MANTKISEYSSTPGNNTDIDGINIAEGCAPSGINNAIRELMSQLKDFQAGTAGDSFNGPHNGTVGATTPASGAFTTLSTTGNTTLGNDAGDVIQINGASTFTNVNPILTAGTANGVAYLNGSKVLTTGSALTFDGSTFTSTGVQGILSTVGGNTARMIATAGGTFFGSTTAADVVFQQNSTEGMRLTSTGLGIGTSSPGARLDVVGAAGTGSIGLFRNTTATSTTTFANPIVKITSGASGADSSIQFTDAITANGYVSWKNSTLNFSTNSGINHMMLDSSGNLGLGVTPSAWGNGRVALQLKSGGALYSGDRLAALSSNAFDDGSFKYISTGAASLYENRLGQHAWYTAPSGTAGNAISFTQAMTLDASGNLVVGTTTATNTANKNLEINGTGDSALNVSVGGTNIGYVYASASSMLVGSRQNVPLVFNTNATERARIDSSGNLLVGTTSSSFGLGSGLQIQRAGTATLSLRNSTDSVQGEMWALGAGYYIYSTTNHPIVLGTNGTEKARITPGGELLVGTSSGGGKVRIQGVSGNSSLSISGYGSAIGFGIAMQPATTAADPIIFTNISGTTVGVISTNSTNTTYTTSSDYRLKNTIAPMTGALAKVQQLKPVTYKWNVDGSEGEGFIAHELQAVVPQCVTGDKDAVETYTDEDGVEQTRPKYQGIDTSFLVATLTAAIQEQQAIINAQQAALTALTTRIESLESK